MRRLLASTLLLVLGCSTARGTILRLRDDAGTQAGDGGARDASADATQATDAQVDAALPAIGTCRIESDVGFLDQFEGEALLAERWLVARGNTPIAEQRALGGFVPENVRVAEGKLVLSVRGDDYAGSVRGFAADGSRRSDGKRTGAAVATRDLYMSASYQWEGRLIGPPGVKVVLVAQREQPSEGYLALTAPGLDGAAPSYAFAQAFVSGPLLAPRTEQMALPGPLDDGSDHSLRFDWHSGVNPAFEPAVDFWMDAQNLVTLSGNGPARAARLWLVAFVPEDQPADFASAEIVIETAFITTLGEVNDRCVDGEVAPGILVEP